MNADNMLYHPDFRALKEVFKWWHKLQDVQVGQRTGKVIIQTYNPDHNTIQQVDQQIMRDVYEQLYDDNL
jgi:primosomal protein N' (replication factor Y)